jgi:hypothetical protein
VEEPFKFRPMDFLEFLPVSQAKLNKNKNRTTTRSDEIQGSI